MCKGDCLVVFLIWIFFLNSVLNRTDKTVFCEHVNLYLVYRVHHLPFRRNILFIALLKATIIKRYFTHLYHFSDSQDAGKAAVKDIKHLYSVDRSTKPASIVVVSPLKEHEHHDHDGDDGHQHHHHHREPTRTVMCRQDAETLRTTLVTKLSEKAFPDKYPWVQTDVLDISQILSKIQCRCHDNETVYIVVIFKSEANSETQQLKSTIYQLGKHALALGYHALGYHAPEINHLPTR